MATQKSKLYILNRLSDILHLCLMLIHEHPQDGIDDMLGRHGLATFEIKQLYLAVKFIVHPHLGLFEILLGLGSFGSTP